MKKIKILLADDHTILRDGLKTLLTTESNYEIIGEADNGATALKLVEELNPDVLILDINMPQLNGLEVLRSIRQKKLAVRVLVLSMYEAERYILDSFSAGADGYLNKMANMSDFFDAINTIAEGKQYVNEIASKALLSDLRKESTDNIKNEKGERVFLTFREIEIIKLIAKGMTSQEIADKLFISYFTVSKHRKNILHKLKMKNTAELVNYAITNNLTPP